MNKKLILIEILIWFFILGAVILVGGRLLSNYFDGQQTYQIVFRDIDSLTVGSPVRFMGIQVGYVAKIRPVKDQVFVDFVITDKKVHIPPGSIISIEFTGIAGSKSIEIKPSSSINHKKTLVTSEPIRIGSLMGLQTDITELTLNLSYNILGMFGRGDLDAVKKNIASLPQSSSHTLSLVKKSNLVIDQTNHKIAATLNQSKNYMTSQQNSIVQIETALKTGHIKEQLSSSLNDLKNNMSQIATPIDNKYINDFHNNLGTQIKSFNKTIADFQKKNKHSDFSMNETVNYVTDTFNQVSAYLKDTFKHENIKNFGDQTKSLKETTRQLNKNVQ